MGADFICCYVPAAKIDECRKRRLLEIAAVEDPHHWDDGGYGSAEDCREAIAQAVEYLAGQLDGDTGRETVVIEFPGAEYPVLLTGGMSWGDTPTDAFDQMDVVLLHAPAVVEQLERWAREDHREELRRRHNGG